MVLTKKELLRKLDNLQKDSDTERAHSEADALLVEFIHDNDIAVAFGKIKKWFA